MAHASTDSLYMRSARSCKWFRSSGHIFREHEELFTEVGWLQVMVGQGILPESHHPLADKVSREELDEYMKTLEALIAREVKQMAHHDSFIAQHCSAPKVDA